MAFQVEKQHDYWLCRNATEPATIRSVARLAAVGLTGLYVGKNLHRLFHMA